MSFLSAGVEYGLHCMLYLVYSAEHGVAEASTRDLADMQGVPAEYVAKLFTKLGHAGLVRAAEGVRGGFSLARPAEKITVKDVVEAIDGVKPVFDCREVRERCAVFGEVAPAWATRGTCSIHAVMVGAEKAMRGELDRHTLADLASRTRSKAPASHEAKVIEWFGARSAARRSTS